MIDSKVAGQEVIATPETHMAPVIDIMEALRKSLEMRKPPMVATASGGALEAVAESPVAKRGRKAKAG